MHWLTDLRKTALLACVGATLSLPIPTWNAGQSLFTFASPKPLSAFWLPPMVIAMIAFTAILPVFLFALFRNERPLVFSKRLRLLSLAAAIVFSVVASPPFTEFARQIRDPSAVLGAVSNVTIILLLITFSRQVGEDPSSDVAGSPLLRIVTNMAVAAWGFWVAWNLLRLLATPYAWIQLRSYMSQFGSAPPALSAMMIEPLRTFFNQACLIVLPYVVYKSRPRGSGIMGKKNGH